MALRHDEMILWKRKCHLSSIPHHIPFNRLIQYRIPKPAISAIFQTLTGAIAHCQV